MLAMQIKLEAYEHGGTDGRTLETAEYGVKI